MKLLEGIEHDWAVVRSALIDSAADFEAMADREPHIRHRTAIRGSARRARRAADILRRIKANTS